MKPFEIFKTGNHTSSNGVTKDYTLEDLEQIADNYNRSEHEAPIVIGHPKSNAPAYGWIEKVFVQGDRLFAKAKDVVENFVNAVKEKKFSKRSISLTKDGLLNHVGFLGATVPAVKGLADVEFNEEKELTEFEYDTPSESIAMREDQSVDQEMLNEETEQDREAEENNKNTGDETSNTPSLHSSNTLERTSRNPSQTDDNSPNPQIKNYFDNLSNTLTNVISDFKEFVNNSKESNLQFMEENKEELDKLHDKMSDLRAKIDVSNFELMLTEKVAYGNLTPAMKKKIVAILNYFETLNFAETDSKTLSGDLQNLLTEFVNSIPKVIEVNEETATKPDQDKSNRDDTFDDFELDPESAALHESIVNSMRQNELTYEEAFYKVVNEK